MHCWFNSNQSKLLYYLKIKGALRYTYANLIFFFQYRTLFKQWETYCSENGLSCFGASSDDIIAYLSHLHQRKCRQTTIYQHVSSLAFHYKIEGLVSPTSAPIVSMFMKGLKRTELELKIKPKQAKPMTKEILKRLIAYLYASPRGLRIWRSVWRINTAFYCILRWDDICRLTVTDLYCVFINSSFLVLLAIQVRDFLVKDCEDGKSYEFTLNGGKTLMCGKDLTRWKLLLNQIFLLNLF